jgi:DNA-binding LacI/PurR family transcriptional regulator
VTHPSKSNHSLGLLSFWECSPHLSETYYQQTLTGIIDGITRSEFPLLLKNVVGELGGEAEFLKKEELSGLVIMAPRTRNQDLGILKNIKIPVVLLFYRDEGEEYSWVDLDNQEGARKATEHLIHLGHNRIAYLGGELELSSNARDRYAGFQTAMKERGILENADWVRHGVFSSEFGKEAAGELLVLPEAVRPTALVCASDMIAFGAMQKAAEMDLRIPGNLSVVGFDNYDQAALHSPPLTTIHQPFYEMGRIAVEMLDSIVQDPQKARQHILIEPELMVRRSTAPPPPAPKPGLPKTLPK